MEYGQYICNCEILHTGIIAPDGSMVKQWEATEKLEEIIRCHDCANFKLDNREHEHREHYWCHRWHSDSIMPDGFCAWAERGRR